MLTVIATILLFGLLVIIHELGHFISAKIFGVRVERFSIGFPPRIAAFKWGETDYQIGAIPFGGYVKLDGEVIEESDADRELNPWEFMAKPAWQRFIIFFSGPFMNFILAILVIFILLLIQGESFIESDTILKVIDNSPAFEAGLKKDDRIIEVNGIKVESWNVVESAEEKGKTITLKIARKDSIFAVKIQPRYYNELESYWLGIEPVLPPYVGKVKKNSPAFKAGLMDGDLLTALTLHPGKNDEKHVVLKDWSDLVTYVHPNLDNPLIIHWNRGDSLFSSKIVPEIEEVLSKDKVVKVGLIGIGPKIPTRGLPFLKAVYISIKRAISFSGLLFKVLSNLIEKPSLQDMGGPIRVVQAVYESVQWGLLHYLSLLAALSVQLAIFNLLPLPVLDGGQITFLIFEGILRKKLSIKQRQISQLVGFALFGLLLIAVTYNDISRLISR
ncbi:MAG: RIP metalloprotease RseP [Candidatus Coatesbacteria bacterium]|nr:RIP metalloprotease RseP [Candidatus Coatesbacteria bacterium]